MGVHTEPAARKASHRLCLACSLLRRPALAELNNELSRIVLKLPVQSWLVAEHEENLEPDEEWSEHDCA